MGQRHDARSHAAGRMLVRAGLDRRGVSLPSAGKASRLNALTPSSLRRERLRDALPASIDMLTRRRASDIPAGYIEDYVALHWLEWHGGGLRVTVTGDNICRQVVNRQLDR